MPNNKESNESDIKLPWKSEIDPYYSASFFTFILFGCIFVFLPFLIIFLLMITDTPSARMGLQLFGWFFFLFFFSLAVIFFWLSLKFRVNYLEIYNNEIKIRTPLRPLKQRVIPYGEIIDLSIGKIPWYYGSRNPYRSSPSKRLHVGFNKIVIYFKNSKPYQISGAWVYDLKTAKILLESKIGKTSWNLTCNHCKKEIMIRRCDTCGVQVCSNCSENDECLKCRLKRHHKRAIISFGFSFIPPAILIIWIIFERFPLFLAFYDVKGNLFSIYYFIFNLMIGILGLAYGLGIWIVELRVIKKIKKNSGVVFLNGFLLISNLGIIILFSKLLYIIQILYSNQLDFIIAMIIELILIGIIVYCTYKMNKK